MKLQVSKVDVVCQVAPLQKDAIVVKQKIWSVRNTVIWIRIVRVMLTRVMGIARLLLHQIVHSHVKNMMLVILDQ